MADLCPHDGDPRSCPPCVDGPQPRRLTDRTPAPTFAARFPSTCTGCLDPIEPGEHVRFVGPGIHHEECADG